jgi:hypothetical protein
VKTHCGLAQGRLQGASDQIGAETQWINLHRCRVGVGQDALWRTGQEHGAVAHAVCAVQPVDGAATLLPETRGRVRLQAASGQP